MSSASGGRAERGIGVGKEGIASAVKSSENGVGSEAGESSEIVRALEVLASVILQHNGRRTQVSSCRG